MVVNHFGELQYTDTSPFIGGCTPDCLQGHPSLLFTPVHNWLNNYIYVYFGGGGGTLDIQ
jgi:hypothetical protein